MRAIIVGGGIGGLTAALSLIKYSWDVVVLEQSEQPGDVGAGIQISPNGGKVLEELGLLKALHDLAFAPQKIEMRIGTTGREVFSIPLRDYALQRWGAPYLHVHRADLIATLREALVRQTPDALHTNNTVTGYRQTDNRISAVLADGDEWEGDLLIGADGIHSVIRAQMLGNDKPRFTGNVAWRAVVPTDALGDLAPAPTACVWTGKQRHAVTYRLRGGALANFVGVVERDDWQSESWTELGRREEALADFAGWHPVIRKLLENAETLHRWALFDRAPLPHWHEGRAVLIGDACHPMLPFLAQGANMAMEDSLTLARCLNTNGQLHGALERYFKTRIRRTSNIQAGARKNMKAFHKPAMAYEPVRLALMLNPQWMHNRMDWIYNHEIPESGQSLPDGGSTPL